MTKLKSKINRFFYRNRNKGVPNLMLYIAIGNLLVYLLYRHLPGALDDGDVSGRIAFAALIFRLPILSAVL